MLIVDGTTHYQRKGSFWVLSNTNEKDLFIKTILCVQALVGVSYCHSLCILQCSHAVGMNEEKETLST